MKLSIVTTLYNSSPYIREFYDRISNTARKITDDYEIVIVNDGSPDNSLDLTLEFLENDDKIKIIDFSRNFGHHKAIVAGLTHSTGKRVFLIDCDLEEKPEWLEDFWQELDQSHCDVIYGKQSDRKGGLYKRFTGQLFYKIFNSVSDIKITENLCTVRLMTRRYVDSVLQLKDRNVFMAGNCAWTGFNQKYLIVEKNPKPSASDYNLLKMITTAMNAITMFSSYPLQIIFVVGFFIFLIANCMWFYIILNKILNPDTILMGYSSVIASIWFFGGLIIMFMGIFCFYLSRLFIEVKDRPIYIIKDIFQK